MRRLHELTLDQYHALRRAGHIEQVGGPVLVEADYHYGLNEGWSTPYNPEKYGHTPEEHCQRQFEAYMDLRHIIPEDADAYLRGEHKVTTVKDNPFKQVQTPVIFYKLEVVDEA